MAGICTLPDLSTAATDGKTKPAQMEIHTSHIQDQKVTGEPNFITFDFKNQKIVTTISF